jgi:two-component system chemotaxis sensor kinase CheA
MSMAKDPLRYFRIEAAEISQALGRGALALEAEATPELVARMLRLAHTLKGAASVVKQRAVAERTHALEDALAPWRDRHGEMPRDAIDDILGHVDAIAADVAALAQVPPEPAGRSRSAVADEPIGMANTDLAEMDGLLGGISEAGVELAGIRRSIDKVVQARHLADLLVDRSRPRSAGQSQDPDGAALEKTRQFAEDLQRLVTGLEQDLETGVARGEREVQQAYAAAERLRLAPCGTAFAPLERAARDAAQALGKRVSVTMGGSDVRIELPVLALVQRALIQLLRNAVAHGIETPAERRAAGKAETGTITIQVERRGNRILFACEDDGAGIDPAAVRRAAEARGLLPQGTGEEALLDLLLRGGVSTSVDVTEAAGRGVGLDVVREIADRLGGTVSARTEAGRGTRVELLVPVSLSAIDALLVETGEQVAAIPLAAVRRALRLAPGDLTRTADRDTIVHGGSAIAFTPLARALRAGTAAARATGSESAIVVGAGAVHAAVGIDRLLGVADIVVRPVPRLALALPVVFGVYVDARGVPHPVLDPDALVQAVSASPGSPERALDPRAPILVIDDSLTTRVLEQSILESAGYDVDLAISAEEALEKAQLQRYSLFLVDVEMPGMDGFAFVERTRADPRLGMIPAILVSSRAAEEDRARGMAAGAHAYIVKSEFDQKRVLETISGLLERA